MIGTTSSEASASQRSSTNMAIRMPTSDSTLAEQRGHVLRDRLVDGIDVVGQAAHQFARAGLRSKKRSGSVCKCWNRSPRNCCSARWLMPAITQLAMA